LTVAPNDAVAQGLWGKQGAAANPQELNRYSYVNNNPVNATDPTGHFLDTILDIAFIAYDVYDIAANGYTAEKGLALAADVGGALIPGLTGAGAMVRAAAHADDVVDAVKVASSAADAVKAACSFPADTPVLTTDGAEAISDVDVGEQVVAWNEATGTTGTYTVTASWAHLDPIIVMLTLDGERIEATPEHPFYVVGKGWTLAEQLQLGDSVQQADGTSGTVNAVRAEQRPQVMYNLTVAIAHTYFVGEGAWLVHNSCGIKLPEIAATAHKELRKVNLGQSTVGAGRTAEGTVTLSVFHSTAKGTEDAVQTLRGRGWNVLGAPTGRTAEFHAERQLADAGFTDIGISRQQGMCNIACLPES